MHVLLNCIILLALYYFNILSPMQLSVVIIIFLIIIILMISSSRSGYPTTIGRQEKELEKGPISRSQNLKVQLLSTGLNKPTSMAFLGPSNILITEKITVP